MKLNRVAAGESGIISGMTRKAHNTGEAVGIPQCQRKEQSEHEAGHYGADRILRIVPGGAGEVRIGKERR